ncbi:MAG: murein transglycosylase domain-containing protein [Gammaproteobacteria bacterium]|nr:murein transglycosylase domain-containing protein [Gammaproteobacteria bacterium]
MHARINILFILASLSFTPSSLLAESFSDYMKQQQDKSGQEFLQYKSATDDEFETYKKQLQDAFKLYKQSVAKVWGKNQTTLPTSLQDVSYRDKLNQRSIIDYKSGEITVDIILSPDETTNTKRVQDKMKQALKTTLNRGSDTRSIIDIAKKPAVATNNGPALLSQLVQDTNGKPLNPANNKHFIEQQSQKISLISTRGTDNRPRIIASTSFPMIPAHLEVRARKYLAPVKKYSNNMKLPPELVFAIMETESAFNPNARSSVPAFGLMQLVPTSGARDAYRLLYNQDKVVSDRYLYNPDNNIKMGTAFIHKLYYSYLSEIIHPEARTWAAIAGYNTGAGNVLITFAGKYRRSKFGNRSNWKKHAFSIINSKTPEQVYRYLQQNLPHKETQHYIKNIRTRIDKYKAL